MGEEMPNIGILLLKPTSDTIFHRSAKITQPVVRFR